MDYLKTALITGATSGIGFELIKLFAKDNINLILVSRNEKKLFEIQKNITNKYKIKVLIFACDLSVSNSSEKVYQFCCSKNLKIHYLVNNAGFGIYGNFINNEFNDIQQMIHLNITSLTELTKYFLINMKKENYGKIMNVASVASFQPGPLMSIYSATKHYVLAFSEGIAEELRKDNISVTTLCPGPTISGFQKRAGFHKNSRLFKSPLTATSKEVAIFGYKKMMAGKRIVIPGFSNKISTILVKFIPTTIKTRIVKKVFDFMH